jgi:hypothetical protein
MFLGIAAFVSFSLYFGMSKAAQKQVSAPFDETDAAVLLIIVLSLLAAWLTRATRD